jgi:hypothetical protein
MSCATLHITRDATIGSSNFFQLDSSKGTIGINTTASFTLDVSGYINTTTGYSTTTGTTLLSSGLAGVSSINCTGTTSCQTNNVSGSTTIGNNTLVFKPSNRCVGIGTASPAYPLDVSGNIRSSTGFYVGKSSTASLTGSVLTVPSITCGTGGIYGTLATSYQPNISTLTLSSLTLGCWVDATSSYTTTTPQSTHIGYCTKSFPSSSVSLTNNTVVNITSISLPAGLWHIAGTVNVGNSKYLTSVDFSSSTYAMALSINTSKTAITQSQPNRITQLDNFISTSYSNSYTFGFWRVHTVVALLTTTTYYLNAYPAYNGGSPYAGTNSGLVCTRIA